MRLSMNVGEVICKSIELEVESKIAKFLGMSSIV